MNPEPDADDRSAVAGRPAPAVATLGGGCFWCLEAVFLDVEGVLSVESGYCNGHAIDPSYEQVCSGTTGHAEVVRVAFDPARIAFRELLEIFFTIHDPTTLDRQGNDVGPQYRSGIYTHDDEQAGVARAVIKEIEASGVLRGAKVVTEVERERNYWRAEDYHQNYFAQHPGQGYCAFVVAPKLEKFRRTFAARRRQPSGA
ncbi:peptide-methionine (S)-S-oxide reductase MsrA [Rivibacter subsaxonicus]|uniref:Peptide methionine sulfoxide reductase MsrA n=1 Tax=Rivibacter subsaxonicus TaxID=457575 RepID=A0A4Q7W1W5_9BURK|nr:peptide-methionine (S)-S-oxide reductase MsrA [Rivibacter subsaxonicus]RZU02539.1 peptide-methionine (S)-S-oxide reductase [Rivibacter subsaxonicus]